MKARKIMLPEVDVFVGYTPVTGPDNQVLLDEAGRPRMEELTQKGRVDHALIGLVSTNAQGARADEALRLLDVRDELRQAVKQGRDHVILDLDAWKLLKARLDAAQFTRNDDVTAAMIRSVRDAPEVELEEARADGEGR